MRKKFGIGLFAALVPCSALTSVAIAREADGAGAKFSQSASFAGSISDAGGRPKEVSAGPFAFDIAKIRSVVSTAPQKDLVVLTSHRGVWRNLPENTLAAMDAAVAANLETIEIDVRLAFDGTPWLVHDYALERISDGLGYLSMNSSAQMRKYHVRQRDGTLSQLPFYQISDVYDWMGTNLFLDSNKVLRGNFILVDLKSPNKVEPNMTKVTGYEALKASWAALRVASKKYPKFNDPKNPAAPGLGQAVAFKVKGRELPADPKTLEADLGLKGDGTDNFYLVPVLHADDFAAGNAVMANYLGKPYILTVEPNPEYIDQPNSWTWLTQLKDKGRSIPGFPGWNEYPEGVAKANGQCCLDRNVDPANPDAPLDYLGSYTYHLQIGADWLTADTAEDLNTILEAKGLRNLSYIDPQVRPRPKGGK